MPMAAALLADSSRLVRLVVPEALLLQTTQLMQARLGGLLGREVIHVPFSRKTSNEIETTATYLRLHTAIKDSSGIVVTLPEHMMSFKLSGQQRILDMRIDEAGPMIEAQNWLETNSRDILDECDFTLAVRTQLVYPSGAQTVLDGHSQRWETVQCLLALVENHLSDLAVAAPESVEIVVRAHRGYPLFFLLREDAERFIIEHVIDDIMAGHMSTLDTCDLSKKNRIALKTFISSVDVEETVILRVRRMYAEQPTSMKVAFLVRGLLVNGIVLLALKKRWNVQYGLHPNRDPVAVPYHAKGVPSENAEWGHPDVAIFLTCLSFYFAGLETNQLLQSLQYVLKSDDPSVEYDRWTESACNLPNSLREWNVINLDDKLQLHELWESLRYEVVVIDHFLNHFVFPKHAKQFSVKIQTSGWDIPLTDATPGTRISNIRPLTTGFSGTNDNRTLLPLNIEQNDLEGLSHTNAEVLASLLETRNREYVVAANASKKRMAEHEVLSMLKERKIRIFIDAGAYILESTNDSLARMWLDIDHEAPAAVFFDEANKPWVLYRKGGPTPLQASPYADDLTDCLVYLDEAHTRGTDLKFPAQAKGALSIGPGQTKDHTVQGW